MATDGRRGAGGAKAAVLLGTAAGAERLTCATASSHCRKIGAAPFAVPLAFGVRGVPQALAQAWPEQVRAAG